MGEQLDNPSELEFKWSGTRPLLRNVKFETDLWVDVCSSHTKTRCADLLRNIRRRELVKPGYYDFKIEQDAEGVWFGYLKKLGNADSVRFRPGRRGPNRAGSGPASISFAGGGLVSVDSFKIKIGMRAASGVAYDFSDALKRGLGDNT